MFKKVVIGALISSLLFINSVSFSIAASNPDEYNTVMVDAITSKTNVLDLKAKASVLIDADSGNILLEKNSHEKLAIASVTKIMTMLLVMEAVDSGKITLDDKVVVSDHAYNMGGSQVYLKAGEVFTVNEMLKALAIHSANDAAVALAEKISGSEDVFVAAMNAKAKELGMNDTNFLDSNGLTDEGHYSSANDVALMSRELITKHPKILNYTSTWHDTFRDGKFSLDNTNKMIRFYNGANGLKTGFTQKAGYCLSASAKRNNLQLISVVLGEPDTNTRFAESRKLLDYGFANYEITQVCKKDEAAGSVIVKKGLKTNINAIFPDDVNLLVKKGEKSEIKKQINLSQDLTAPIQMGQKVGEVIFKIGDKEIGKADVVSDQKVDKASFLRLFFRMVLQWFGVGRL